MRVVAEASDGVETLEFAIELQPDVLLLDISMPRLNGVQVAKQLREEASQVRIVVLTGYDTDQYREALLHLGVRGYLPKTVSSQELVAALREVYGGGVHIQSSPSMSHQTACAASDSTLTPRELEVLRLVDEGLSNAAIANRLSMSQRTVQFHLTQLFAKLDATSRTHVVHIARQRGWIV